MFTMGTTTFGSVVVYQCSPGYELTGIGDALSRECQDTGMWSLMDPTCKRKPNETRKVKKLVIAFVALFWILHIIPKVQNLDYIAQLCF